MLHIPDRPKRRSALMLPFLLGLTVLLYTVVLMPVRQDRAEGGVGGADHDAEWPGRAAQTLR